MFESLTGSIENLLDIHDAVLDGDLPSKQQLMQLIDDGIDVDMIASALGVSEDVIQKILDN